MQEFTIKGTTGKKYAVTLFPKEICQCPSTGFFLLYCCFSIGLDAETNTKKDLQFNSRNNGRLRKNKQSGRKRPREGDLDDDLQEYPAPDSIFFFAKV